MRNSILSLATCLLFFLPVLHAQDFSQLAELNDYKVKVYYSTGYEQRAISITERVDKAFDYYHQLLNVSPEVTLLVLTVEDWTKYTSMPVIGMPHYKDDKVLVVAAHDNAFWQSFIPPMDKLPVTLADQIRAAYKNDRGELSMQPFFDLLALHELGHAFHFQEGINMQRKWMGELFVNIMLHTYIAEKQPELLPALETFPNMVVGGGTAEYKFTSLEDFEKLYETMGMGPKNYGWYQCKLHSAAKDIYNAGGKNVLQKLWKALKKHQEKMNDDDFIKMLQKEVHPSVAEVYLKWEQ